jgi:SAM-dependent methyltransferase
MVDEAASSPDGGRGTVPAAGDALSDRATLGVYAARAREYDALDPGSGPDRAAFLAALPAGDGPILDWGCGPGHDAAAFAAADCRVEATDATEEMVALARSRGVDARVETFATLAPGPRYRGIWANFSLLHADGPDLPGLIGRAAEALLPGGVLHLGMKRGSGTRRDRLGRRYSYVEAEDLDRMTAAAGLGRIGLRFGEAVGLDGRSAAYVIHLSRADG